jgi:carboxypeptidase C (cathepsin A)
MRIVGIVAFATMIGWFAVTRTAVAQPSEPQQAKSEAPKEAVPKPVPAPKAFTTHHTGRFGDRTLSYTATAGETYLNDDNGDPKASIFSFAYIAEGERDLSRRPVAFIWNGGPGSSSIWLHMGSMGPRRAAVPSDARDDGPPPYTIEDNPHALLDVTDLVFVDPVGTGFSRPLGKHEGKEFWGLSEDTRTMAEFVRAWITKNRRWSSPKYLIGESFGTTRAAAVAGLLEGGPSPISLNGLILISQALDYTGSSPEPDNVIAFITYLPTMAATAWYHNKIKDRPASLEEFLRQARAFAVDEYAPALLKGQHLDAATRDRIAERLAHFTGLSREYVVRSDLMILADRFRKELLRSDGKSVGRIDGRYAGDDIDDVGERPEGDPSSYSVDSAFAASLSQYLAAELNVEMDRDYAFSGGRQLGSQWNWKPANAGPGWEPSYVNVARDLSRALRRNSGLRVMVASGYFDFATPFFDAEYTFARHGILPERITMTYYEAGHMMYLHRPSLERLMADARKFIRAGAGGGTPTTATVTPAVVR